MKSFWNQLQSFSDSAKQTQSERCPWSEHSLAFSKNGLEGVDLSSGNGSLCSTGFLFAQQPRSHHMSWQLVGWHSHKFSNAVGLSVPDCVCGAVDWQLVSKVFVFCVISLNGKH